MPTKKISQLVLDTAIVGGDVLPIVSDSATKKVTVQTLADFARGPTISTPAGLANGASVTGYALPAADVVRLAVSGASAATLEGLGVTGDGRQQLLVNVGASAAIVIGNATGPVANARFRTAGGTDQTLAANGGFARVFYDSASAVWRVV